MSLSDPQPRQHIHTRRVVCNGYRRSDGLWDIEGHIVDVKTGAMHTVHRGDIEPGDPIHEMRLRLTVTDDFEVTDIEAVTLKSPFHICDGVTGSYKALIGLTIGAGWNRAIKERLGGVRGCSHLTELLGPIATTAFQTIYPIVSRERAERAITQDKEAAAGRHDLLDVCHVFDTTGAFVQEHWPEHYTGPKATD